MQENNLNNPKLGMQLSKHPSELTLTEYSLMLNGDVVSSDGNVFKVTNTPSNLLCSKFKDGFQVIGVLPINQLRKAIFFIVNPSTGDSEIGEILNISYNDGKDDEVHCSNCNTPIIEDVPLELTKQSELCKYNTIISASCLNFDINYPISATYEITSEGVTIYFASKNNPIRFIKLWDIPKIITGYDNENCNLPIYSGDLDCNAIKLFPEYSKPCINPLEIISGGNLQAGVYQFTFVYSDKYGNYLTDFTLVTNPISIYKSIISTNTDYPTGNAIKVQIENIDTNFKYFSLVVLQTIDNQTSAFEIDNFPITGSSFSYTYSANNSSEELRVPIDLIEQKRPVYENARLVTNANGFLFAGDLKEKYSPNLQPVINDLTVKWATVEADEDLYSDGIACSKYKTFPRGEVIALGISFIDGDGFETATFPLIGRAATQDDIEEVATSDPNYLPDNSCYGEQRNKKWQVYDTSSVDGNLNCPSGHCSLTPYQYGKFAYWQSSLNYPNNPEVWADLCGKPIRHFKLPENCTSSFMNTPSGALLGTINKIYPIGIKIDVNDIKIALNEAVSQGLITEQQKNKITSYRIKRGNRVGNKSIIAKGLIHNIGKIYAFSISANGTPYPNTNEHVYFPNWGFNDVNGQDPYINDGVAGLINYTNSRYTFISPDTLYNDPTLPTESHLEFTMSGVSQGRFNEVEKHAKYILLKNDAYVIANVLGAAEALTDLIVGQSSADLGAGFALAVTAMFTTIVNYQNYTQDWLRIITNLGSPYNPAIYYTALGKYTNYWCPSGEIKTRQVIDNARYLTPGNISFFENNENIRLNNFNRERSVYLKLPEDFEPTVYMSIYAKDNSKENLNCNIGVNVDYPYKQIASHYTSLRNYIPDQYGTIDQIEWIDTGYCGNIDWGDTTQNNECDIVFGGDTFISRFAYLNKFPYFIQDRVNYNTQDDVTYRVLSNVGATNYYFNSIDLVSSTNTTLVDGFLSIWNPPDVNLECDGNNVIYHKGKLNLYNYSVQYFLVESDYNNNFRRASDEFISNFYPNYLDIPFHTQQVNIPITTEHVYLYNTSYSKQNKENFTYILPDSYSQSQEEVKSEKSNRVIYSNQGSWTNFLANDYYDFYIADGKLTGLKGIEQQSILVTQENASNIFNAFITAQTSLSELAVSTGKIFTAKPKQYYKTDLGFGGSTHKEIVSTQFGHFFVDTKNPAIFRLTGDSLINITEDTENKKVSQWFKENLPFNILKDFPNVDIDNSFNNFGISMGWDNRLKKLLITKKDYKLLPEYKDKIVFQNNNFYYNDIIIQPTDKNYFCDKSWTVGYNPQLDQFISLYSFIPDYYISSEESFYIGTKDDDTSNLWAHNITNRSFQVFQGKLNPFIVEFSTKYSADSKIIGGIWYQSQFLRYQDNLNFYNKNDVTFNKAIIYNQTQSSGLLELVVKEKNNLYQIAQYGNKITSKSRQILVENIENTWQFNNYYNVVNANGQPIMVYSCESPIKDINPKAIDYKPVFYKEPIRGNWQSVRLINDKHSNYRILINPIFSSQISS